MADEAKWYVVHTYSGYENKVATNLEKIVENRKLQDWIHEIRVPTETVVEVKDNKKREGPNGKPIPLTEEEVAALGVEKREIEVNYAVGDTVRIIDGPLENFTGIVDELDREKNKVRVTISMFGRETPVELELDQAELME